MSDSAPSRRTSGYVERVIHRLVPPGAGGISPRSRAELAQLRRGVGREAGSVPEIWELTLGGLDQTGMGDGPSREENAVHTALTIFAVHQQSQTHSMHRPEVPFGQAIRRLALLSSSDGNDIHEGPVYRRFAALSTSSSLAELAHHSRGLVGQLRAADIGFDYARFTDDLMDFQDPFRIDRVRRRWGRDFHHVPREAVEANALDGTSQPTSEGDPE